MWNNFKKKKPIIPVNSNTSLLGSKIIVNCEYNIYNNKAIKYVNTTEHIYKCVYHIICMFLDFGNYIAYIGYIDNINVVS